MPCGFRIVCLFLKCILQCEPYLFFGCDLNSRFHGTLFRFPLRTEVTSKASEIKNVSPSEASVKELLDAFRRTIHLTLLFVRNVRRIEVYQLPADAPTNEPVLLYHAEVLPQSADAGDGVEIIATPTPIPPAVLSTRRWPSVAQFIQGDSGSAGIPFTKAAFIDKLRRTSQETLPRENDVFRIQVVDGGFAGDVTDAASAGGAGAEPITVLAPGEVPADAGAAAAASSVQEVFQFFVHCRIGGSRARDMAVDESHKEMKLLPWGSVAALLSHSVSDRSLLEFCPPMAGHAFCFLPLPVETQLPVHVRLCCHVALAVSMHGGGWSVVGMSCNLCLVQVNGYFELSANRRELWSGRDTAGEGRARGQWNTLLLEDVIAPSYARVLKDATKHLGFDHYKDFYKLWPHPIAQEPWSMLVKSLYRYVKDQDVLYSRVDGGRWVSPQQAVLIDDDDVVNISAATSIGVSTSTSVPDPQPILLCCADVACLRARRRSFWLGVAAPHDL